MFDLDLDLRPAEGLQPAAADDQSAPAHDAIADPSEPETEEAAAAETRERQARERQARE